MPVPHSASSGCVLSDVLCDSSWCCRKHSASVQKSGKKEQHALRRFTLELPVIIALPHSFSLSRYRARYVANRTGRQAPLLMIHLKIRSVDLQSYDPAIITIHFNIRKNNTIISKINNNSVITIELGI
jgi:hypothetical protein